MDPTTKWENPQHNPTVARSISGSYNPVTHLSRLGFNKKGSRRQSQSPPPPKQPHHETLKRTLSNSVSLDKNPHPPQPFPQQDRQISKTATSVRRVFHDMGFDKDKKKKSMVVVVRNSSNMKGEHRGLMPTPVGEDESDKEKVKRTETVRSSELIGLTSGKGKSKMMGGKRVSFGGEEHYSKEELRNFMTTNGVNVVAADMPPYMQIHAVGCARKTRDSLEKFTSKALALSLKKEFDGIYGPAWHCIVGTSFGSFVTHSIGGFLYFSMDHKLYILLFKTSVQKVGN